MNEMTTHVVTKQQCKELHLKKLVMLSNSANENLFEIFHIISFAPLGAFSEEEMESGHSSSSNHKNRA